MIITIDEPGWVKIKAAVKTSIAAKLPLNAKKFFTRLSMSSPAKIKTAGIVSMRISHGVT